jgi:preprotein translocase subunit Sss1
MEENSGCSLTEVVMALVVIVGIIGFVLSLMGYEVLR